MASAAWLGLPARKVIVGALALALGLAGGVAGWLAGLRSSGRRIAAARGLPHPAAVAHRGASHWAPENTLPAFELARDMGVDFVETDVQRSSDGVLFCFHDKIPGGDPRGPDGRPLRVPSDVAVKLPGRAGEPIGSFTWEELRRLDVGGWFNQHHPERARASFVGLRIPSFDDYLDAVGARPGVGLLIELKAPERSPGIEEQVLRALVRRGWQVEPPPSAPKRSSGSRDGEAGLVVLQSF